MKYDTLQRKYKLAVCRTAYDKLQLLFLDWWNDFLTVDYFAEYYEVSRERAERIIAIGRTIHNRRTSRWTITPSLKLDTETVTDNGSNHPQRIWRKLCWLTANCYVDESRTDLNVIPSSINSHINSIGFNPSLTNFSLASSLIWFISERFPKGVSHLPIHIEDVKQTRKRVTEHLDREFTFQNN